MIVDPKEKWANETAVTLQRFALERAVKALDKVEGIALVRAAYGCNLEDGKTIYAAICNR